MTVAAVCPDAKVEYVLRNYARLDWRSFDVRKIEVDVGCNETWLVAAYTSRTSRIIVLHDDDRLLPEFGEAFRHMIAPHLSSGVGFASWRAALVYDDGRRKPTEYSSWGTKVMPATNLLEVVDRRGRLSLSPVISVLDRDTVILACKEAEQTLRHNDNLMHPGMLLGTEILVYLRHIQKFPLWLHVDRVLSLYGSHVGSGTIQAEKGENGGIARLAWGYDRARNQARVCPPAPRPRIILTTFQRAISNPAERRRVALAEDSRAFLQGAAELIRLLVDEGMLPRILKRKGNGNLPYIKDLLDIACAFALPEDVIVYSNDDVGLTTEAPGRILAGIERGHGVTVCPRRNHGNPRAAMKSVLNCPIDGGIDVIAVTVGWWANNRHKMPDMLIGTDAWDTVFRVIAEEWADGGLPREHLETDPHRWLGSRAYTDDVCWHTVHLSRWIKERRSGKGDEAGRHNRKLAREFFADRGNQDGLTLVAESESKTKK